MSFENQFKDELADSKTQYFIFDTKGGGKHGDVDFIQYQWSRSKYNLVNEGDVFLCRRPGKASETGKFYFFGAAKVGTITGDGRVTAQLIKAYPFQEYLHQGDLERFNWSWKKRGENWEHFFNQYGMNKINKDDFVRLLSFSEGTEEDEIYEPAAATEALQGMQGGNYFVDDKEGKSKIRAKQQVFSNKVKTNYGNRCAICSISTKQFLMGSHIVPWAIRKDIRLDPANGICLCSLHDKAFDKGFITIDKEYKVVISKNIISDDVLLNFLKTHNGKKLHLPKVDQPNIDFLVYHQNNIFDKYDNKAIK